jgi:hypothetical protein
MTRLALAVALAGLALLPATAAAKPPVCDPAVLQQALIDAGKLTAEDVGFGEVVDLVRCGDVTNDGATDAVFTLASGGTAGDTRFGVWRGGADGSPAELVLYRRAYSVGIVRRNRRSFATIQPHYASGDANCCPSSFRVRRFTWTGTHFARGKARKLETRTPPRRFYRP